MRKIDFDVALKVAAVFLLVVGLFCSLFILLFSFNSTAHAESLNINGNVVQYDGDIIRLMVDGKVITTDVPPVIIDDRTLVPARAVFEQLGATVTWNPDLQKVGIETSEKSLSLTINDKIANVNGFPAVMDVPAMIINNRTFIPLRFVGEHLGFKVGWHPDNDAVSVNTDSKITELQFNSLQKNASELLIRANREINSYTIREDVEGQKLIIDIDSAFLGLFIRPGELDDPFVKSIKYIQYSENPYRVRIELDMKKWTNYKTEMTSDQCTLMLRFSSDGKNFNGVSYNKDQNEDSILLKLDNVPRYNAFRLTGPDRLVIDLSDTYNPDGTRLVDMGGLFVKAVRYSQFASDTTRVVLDLNGQYQYDILEDTSGLRINVKNPTYKNLTYINNGDSAILEIQGVDLTGKYSKRMDVEKQSFVLAFSAGKVDLGDGKININDSFLTAIEIRNYPAENLTRLIFQEKNYFVTDIVGIPAENKTQIIFYKAGTAGKDRLVVIDAGHGDADPGAVWGDLKEKDFNVDIARRLNALLEGKGIKTYMTREDDTFVGLYDRAYIADNLQATLFVSLHNNAVWDQNVSGTMTLYNPDDGINGFNGKRFAQIAQAKLIDYLGLPDRKIVPRPELVVLNQTKMPAILAEIAFLTNEGDRKKLQTEEFRQKAAQALCDAVVQALNEKSK